MVFDKTCIKCGLTGDRADEKTFIPDQGREMNICRECWNQRDRAYRHKHKTDNPDKAYAAQRTRTKKHREAHPDYRRQEYVGRVKRYGLAGLNEKARNAPYARSEKAKADGNAKNWRLKLRVIEVLGGCCYCCGEAHPKFLTIDHVNNDGATQRREKKIPTGSGSYRHILKTMPDDIRLACWNCNSGRDINNGICPHEDIRLRLVV